MERMPIALTEDVIGIFARGAAHFADGLTPGDQAVWQQLVMRAGSAQPRGGAHDDASAQAARRTPALDWSHIWQPDTLIAPLLAEGALVRSFRSRQPVVASGAGTTTTTGFVGRLVDWSATLDDLQLAMLTDLLVRAGGDDASEPVGQALVPDGGAFSGDLFAPVEFFDYQSALHGLVTEPSAFLHGQLAAPHAKQVLRLDVVDEWGRDSFPASDPPPGPATIG